MNFKYMKGTGDTASEKKTLTAFRSESATYSTASDWSWSQSADGLTRTGTKTRTKTQVTYNYKQLGPFKLKFNEENGVSSVKVNNTTKNAGDTGTNIYWIEKSNYSDSKKAGDWNKDVGKIPSNTAFYLATYKEKVTTKTTQTQTKTQTRVSTDKGWTDSNTSGWVDGASTSSSEQGNITPDNSEYKVKFKQTPIDVYSGRLLFQESSMLQQNMTFVGSATPTSVAGSAEYSIESKGSGSITIIKRDKDTNQKLGGVSLKIYGITSAGSGWVKQDGSLDGTYANGYTWVTSSEEDQKGKVKIENLAEGDYYVYEIATAAGFDLETQRTFYQSKIVGTDPNGFDGLEEYGYCVYLGEINSEYNNVKETFYQYHPIKLTLRKVDEDTGTPVPRCTNEIIN